LQWIWGFAVDMEICSGYGDLQWIWRFAVDMEICSGYGDLQWIWRFAVDMEISTLEEKTNTLSRNVMLQIPSDTAPCPWKRETSAA